ncbi:alpha/beta hydrolase family esterase [Amycolatopsis sp. NPDC059021]|uniref:alpha/beta hydrolase family esterase n=1 Tax=Amycolatopsis sp. NPDC059021 TaxID=3346704 RepID=UPI00366BB9CB
MPGRRRVVGRLAVAAAMAAGLLAACSSAATASPPDRVLDFALPSAGCLRPPAVTPGATVPGKVVSGGIERTYLLHVPQGYQPHRPTSLILSFHGHKRTSAYQESLSGFDSGDSIAVYPQGLAGTDGETAWTGAPYSNRADDVLFVSDLLNQLQQQLCVDPARIHAAGKSNGGGFTGVLACRMSGRIASFAPVSGAFYDVGAGCSPTRPAPILDFHGTADQTIPYAGNAERKLPSIPDWMAAWARRDGCAATPVVRDLGKGVSVSTWPGCARGAKVEHYRLEGLGHVWPSTKPNLDSDKPTAMDATPVIERFFAEHPLRPGPR